MDYQMMVKIPIKDVPDNISIQEAKVTSEIWLVSKIPDADLVSFTSKDSVPYPAAGEEESNRARDIKEVVTMKVSSCLSSYGGHCEEPRSIINKCWGISSCAYYKAIDPPVPDLEKVKEELIEKLKETEGAGTFEWIAGQLLKDVILKHFTLNEAKPTQGNPYEMKPEEIRQLGGKYEIWEARTFYGYDEKFLPLLASAAQQRMKDWLLSPETVEKVAIKIGVIRGYPSQIASNNEKARSLLKSLVEGMK